MRTYRHRDYTEAQYSAGERGAYNWDFHQIRDLAINSLRMRPDRIIVGERCGAETIDTLQAMNAGHNGLLTTPWIFLSGEPSVCRPEKLWLGVPVTLTH